MAIGGSMSGITFSGLATGIDTDSIIKRLIQLESVPVRRLQARQAELTSRMGLYSNLRGLLQSVATAASTLNFAGTYDVVKASSSRSEVATITASTGGVAGTYELSVTRLAQAHKVSSAAQSSPTAELGLSGTIAIAGKAIEVQASDTLTTLAQKINSAQSAVVASVINGGPGNAYLTLTASSTGAQSAIVAADLGGGVLQALGLYGGAPQVREAITNGARGIGFSARDQAVGTLIGTAGPGPTTVTINGQGVEIDLASDSLDAIATKINLAAIPGVAAAVTSATQGGRTVYRLEITGASTPTFGNEGGVFQALGILQMNPVNQIVAAQDASFTLDNVAMTNPTNVLTNLIPGATITLLKANESNPERTTLTLTRDVEAVKGKIRELANAFNALVDFVDQNSQFNKDTYASGPLFGDAVANQAVATLSARVLETVTGLRGSLSNLTALGFGFDDKGKLTVDDALLTSAVNENPLGVRELLMTIGQGSINEIAFMNATPKTRTTTGLGYEVVITRVATKGKTDAALAQTAASAEVETLTFGGAAFGNVPYTLVLPAGSTLQQTVDRINADPTLKGQLVASIESGRLRLTSLKYGTPGEFTVVSDLEAASNNSGIGTTQLVSDGVDVAGTIAGEEAIGKGQFLTGKDGNTYTDGLQIMYTGTATGPVGFIRYTRGLGARLADAVSSFTDSINGFLTTSDKNLQTEFDDLSEQINRLQTQLKSREEALRRRFAAMEQAISQMNAQMARLTAFVASSNARRNQ